MLKTKDVHKQFANYFPHKELKPFLYLLSKGLSEGHICIDLNLLNHAELREEGFLEILPKEKLINHTFISKGEEYQPLVLWDDKLYLQRYYHYETTVFEKIRDWIKSEEDELEQRKHELNSHIDFISQLFPTTSLQTTDWQLIAALSVVLNKFTVLTGGPGTGKTTTVAKIVGLMFKINPNLRVALAAPTGKAAARMSESLKNAWMTNSNSENHFDNLVPSTIHRLLGFKKNSIYFKHNSENLLPFDLIIIDESSMIDIALFSKLVSAIPTNTKIIFLGDKDQLASVEAGSLFGDLCMAQNELNQFSSERIEFFNQFIDSENAKIPNENAMESDHLLFEHVIELKFSHRFSDDEGIGKFSKAILRNEKEKISDFFDNENKLVQIDSQYSEKLFHDFVLGFKEYIEEKDIIKAFEKLNKFRILCAIREGEEGVYAINDKAQKVLHALNLLHIDSLFYENRPIIVNNNNYELGLFNGDIGIVRKDENGITKVWFLDEKGNPFSILPAFIESAETVFTMTIHKSQGSEFENVMVILPNIIDIPLLTRELLYTAVTRAKEKVIIQSTEEGILNCADKRVQRGSGIIDRFK